MKLILEVVQGEEPGQQIEIREGESVRLGKDSGLSDISFPLDPAMSLAHCVVGCDSGGGSVRDLNSMAGTFVNRIQVRQGRLKDGDYLSAGGTIFRVQVVDRGGESGAGAGGAQGADAEDGAGAGAAAEPSGPKPRLLALLKQEPLPLLGLFDAARDPKVLDLLATAGAQGESLFDGEPAAELAGVAPYLVLLDKESPLLADLVEAGWGDSWGVYLTSADSFQNVRWHLREFLMVADENGKEMYFRFYDPRVLRLYLPTCNAEEARRFFGPVDRFIVEENAEKVLYFLPGGQAPQMTPIDLTATSSATG